MKCLVIRHVAFEDLGGFAPVLEMHGFQISYAQAGVDHIDVREWMGVDLLVVLGGPVGVMDNVAYPWLVDETEGLRLRLSAQRPTLGICLGAQLIAAALGGSVYPGTKEIGWSALSLVEGPTDSGSVGHPLVDLQDVAMLHWHGDTFDLPRNPAIRLLASTRATPHQAFNVGNYGLALQFHPEVDYKQIEAWLVGHAVELQLANVDLDKLRIDSMAHGPAAYAAGQKLLRRWLGNAGFTSVEGVQIATAYRAVNCDFHDVLESVATLGKTVNIEVQLPDGDTQTYRSVIGDVFSKDGAEYIALRTGESIRLDHLISVDSKSSKQFG